MATLEPLYSFLVSYNSSFCLKDTLFSFLKTAKQSNMLLIEIKKKPHSQFSWPLYVMKIIFLP